MDSVKQSILKTSLFATSPKSERADNPDFLFLQRALAEWIAAVAIGLAPAVVLLGAQTCFRASISDYYYDPWAGNVFVAALASIAVLLFAYRGRYPGENRLALACAIAALCVAFFPTGGPGCTLGDGDVGRVLAQVVTVTDGKPIYSGEALAIPVAETVHFTAAVLLFSMLAWFCLNYFTRVDPNRDLEESRAGDGVGRLPEFLLGWYSRGLSREHREGLRSGRVRIVAYKLRRNAVYMSMGLAMVAVMLLLLAWWLVLRDTTLGERIVEQKIYPVLIGEFLALLFFGLAWLQRGRAPISRNRTIEAP